MPTLTRRTRAMLLFLSASGYVAWFSGLGDPGDAADIAATPAPGVPTPYFAPRRRPTVTIVRDPFSGAPTSGAERTPDAGAPTSSLVPPGRAQGQAQPANDAPSGVAAGDPSVPNIGGASDVADAAPPALTVRATIVGPNAVAYVENGAEMDIVRVGDTLGSERVAAIDLGGIAFTDGSRLDLSGATALTPTPRPEAPSIAKQLGAIRALLEQARAHGWRAAPPAVVTVAVPQSTPSQAPATPGPLPTPETQGLEPGVNPTPDLTGPTAFPYPYPYPPPPPPAR